VRGGKKGKRKKEKGREKDGKEKERERGGIHMCALHFKL
jgi:hypothetical protein